MSALRVSLTFDDGPSATTTPQILAVLEAFSVPASFFLVGKNISKATGGLIKRQIADGCSVECHSFTHTAFEKLTPLKMKEEIAKTNQLIKQYSGTEPQFFRPPYISYTDECFMVTDLAFICGHGVNDWDSSVSIEQRVNGVVDCVQDGQIILLHDSEGNDKTVQALGQIIEKLKKMGTDFYTVPQLFTVCKINPHQKGVLWSNVLHDGLNA